MRHDEVAEALRELLPEVQRLAFWLELVFAAAAVLAATEIVRLLCDEKLPGRGHGHPGDR